MTGSPHLTASPPVSHGAAEAEGTPGTDEARRALSDPRRVRMWERLAVGPATAKGLGEALGMLPNRLYYHLRILQSAGLVDVVDTEATGRMVERVYGASHRHVSGELGRGAAEERLLFFSSLLEATRNEIVEVLAAQSQAPGGQPPPLLDLHRGNVRTTAEGAADLGRRIRAVIEDVEREWPATDARYRLLCALYEDPPPAAARTNDRISLASRSG